MKNKYFTFFAFIFVFTTTTAQSTLSDYSYVLVPKQFGFQSSEDQYQLNSITKFLFNKHGFNAYFKDELPNVKRCDGLYAEVHGSPNFIWTKVYIVLKDCNGMEVYQSAEGRSKLKEYSKTYNQALRNAFESFANLGVQQRAIIVSEENTKSTMPKEEILPVEKNTVEKNTESPSNELNLPQSRYTPFKFQGASYMLRKANEGFSLYKETTDAVDDGLFLQGKLMIKDGKLYYEDLEKTQFTAKFDASGNLWIDAREGKKKYLRQ